MAGMVAVSFQSRTENDLPNPGHEGWPAVIIIWKGSTGLQTFLCGFQPYYRPTYSKVMSSI